MQVLDQKKGEKNEAKMAQEAPEAGKVTRGDTAGTDSCGTVGVGSAK